MYFGLIYSAELRGKFLKKMWCCVGGEYNKKTGFIMYIGHRKEIRKLTFRTLALRRSESRNCGLYVVYLYIERWSYAIGWCMVTWKTTE